jgi:putative spermidine/putrescine transport system permease protein
VLGDAWCSIKGVFGAPCETAPEDVPLGFVLSGEVRDLLPRTAIAYSDWAAFTVLEDGDVVAEEEPYEAVFVALADDLRQRSADELETLGPDLAPALIAAKQAVDANTPATFRELFLESDEDWGSVENWRVMKRFSGQFTPGYYLSAIDADSTAEGFELKPEDERIYLTLFVRTMWMSILITVCTLLLGYPIAYLMSHSKRSTANLLMILVLLPFWTSLLVRTSAWKVLLQQQGVINDFLVWINLIDDAGRLVMINNQLGTIIAMTHILLPFMILPLYSVMQTVSPSFVRAAKSMGANDWTAFWRIYFPNTVPGIGAGAILVFILSIGYYITPELVGGTQGVFISNRIAYHIQFSLNWGLAAALGAILLLLVIVLFYFYDRIVGIDNVKLG